MTRISSYGLYKCTNCSQIHIKPNYGSISIYVPLDVFIKPTEIITCKKCGIKKEFSEFLYIGMSPKQNSHKPNLIERIAIKFGYMKPIEELDVRKLYPNILDF